MAERGAIPEVSPWRLRALRSVRSLFTPLLPDDYLELINPLWSTQELRGRIERIKRETDDAVTVLIRPGYQWPGHRPGQYLQLGMVQRTILRLAFPGGRPRPKPGPYRPA